jgi:hypothetical protein
MVERVVGQGTKRELNYLLSDANTLRWATIFIRRRTTKIIRIGYDARLHLVSCDEMEKSHELHDTKGLPTMNMGKSKTKNVCLVKKTGGQ